MTTVPNLNAAMSSIADAIGECQGDPELESLQRELAKILARLYSIAEKRR